MFIVLFWNLTAMVTMNCKKQKVSFYFPWKKKRFTGRMEWVSKDELEYSTGLLKSEQIIKHYRLLHNVNLKKKRKKKKDINN